MKQLFWAFAAMLGFAGPASATVVVNVFDDVGGLTFQTSGSLDTRGLTLLQYFNGPTDIRFGSFEFLFWGSPAQLYSGVTGPTGSFGGYYHDSFTGDAFGLRNLNGLDDGRAIGPQLLLPAAYVSGSSISNFSQVAGVTLANTSLIKGTYEWSLPNDKIRLVIGESAAIPLPAGAPLLLTGIAGFAWLRRRKAKKA